MIIKAYVNHGRWIAECPRCTWAIEIRRDFALFLCGRLPNEQMTGTGCGLAAGVQFPGDAHEVEAVLKVRPQDKRHWYPGESVADLRIENAANGLPSGLEVA